MAQVSESYYTHTKRIDATGAITAAEVNYVVTEATGEDEALTAVLGVAPAVIGKASLDSIEIDDKDNESTFHVTAVYEKKFGGMTTSSEATESFECGGGTKHMVHAIEQSVVYAADGDTTDDSDGAIGWNGKPGSESEIAGVDVPTADMRQSYTKLLNASHLTAAYKKKVAALVGKVNSSSWKDWSAGEVMFLGMSCSGPTSGKVTVTYNFRVSPNETSCTIAGHDIGAKAGFEYVWARSNSTVSGTRLQQSVVKIYKAKVCQSGNFADLGI